MAVAVPDWADTLLDLVGVNWPNVDEDAYRDIAGNTITFTRDAFGRPVTADAGGAVTTLEWTVEGLPARRTAPDDTTHTWEYDGEGNSAGRRRCP